MAIDMIERTSEGAHAPSRLGLHQFADENNNFKNFTGGQDFFQGGGEDWANLFGSKKRKSSLKENQEAEAKVWSSYPTATCDEIQRLIDALGLRAETLVKQIAAQPKDPFYPVRIVVVREFEGKTKSLQLQNDCLNIVAKAREDAQKQETLSTITNLSEKSIQNAKNDLLGINLTDPTATASPNKKLILYGGIGVGAVILLLLLRQK
jgi:hypothetical protein